MDHQLLNIPQGELNLVSKEEKTFGRKTSSSALY